jgi:hypothetical protein
MCSSLVIVLSSRACEVFTVRVARLRGHAPPRRFAVQKLSETSRAISY